MQLSPIMNLIGAVLIVTAIVLHIVCLATPHWAGADSDRIKEKVNDMIEEMEGMDADMENTMNDIRKQAQVASMLASGDINYGLWKMCIHSVLDLCANWASETKSNDDTGTTASLKTPDWIRGVQAMAILGLLVAVAASVMAGIHLFVPSRGDRLRLLPVFICITTFVAGALVLCGDIILAAKYDKLLEFFAEQENQVMPREVLDILESAFFLSWGFALDVVAAALLLLAGLFYIVGGRAAQAGGVV